MWPLVFIIIIEKRNFFFQSSSIGNKEAELPSVEDVPANLFKDHQGEAIHFHMFPGPARAKLKPYVVAGGGILNYSGVTDQSISLVAPGHQSKSVSFCLII